MTTTAEGVETLDQLERQQTEGCTEVQCYYFSRPRLADEIPQTIAVATPLRRVGARPMACDLAGRA